MAVQPSSNVWKEFLQARILQEKGNDAQSLEIFDKLANHYPDNEHFQTAKTFALARLGRRDEAIASNVTKLYTDAAKKLNGSEDRSESWINELNSLVSEVDKFSNISSPVSVVW